MTETPPSSSADKWPQLQNTVKCKHQGFGMEVYNSLLAMFAERHVVQRSVAVQTLWNAELLL